MDHGARYQRQIALPQIGESGQARLRSGHVVVVGAGGLGCPALQYLAAAGVGRLTIVDFDRVETSNLNRQILFNPSDVGKPKAIVATEKLGALNTDVRTTAITQPFNTENADTLLPDCDVALDCTDRPDARYAINDACVKHNKPFVYAGIHRFEGQLGVFNYNGSATYRCAFPEAPDKASTGSCETNGVLGTVPGILGIMQANEAIKILTASHEVMRDKLLLINFLTNDKKDILLKRKATADALTERSWGIHDITPEALSEQLAAGAKIYFLDVREPHEMSPPASFQGDQIPTSRWDPERAAALLRANTDPVVFCQHGIRSRAVIASLPRDLQSRVRNLEGGLAAFLQYQQYQRHE